MKYAVSGAVVSAVAGFSLAAAMLAVNLEPQYWVPTVSSTSQASVTVVDPTDLATRQSQTGGGGSEPYQLFAMAGPNRPKVAAAVVKPVETFQLPQIPSELGIPGIVLQAYKQAEEQLSEVDASCNLDWAILAGVGKIESGHARNGAVWADGTTFEPILGPVLDGGLYAGIPDTDDGVLDGDPVWDRAVGPMQFIPGTWAFVGADGNGDGVASPHNIFDAALSAGLYLCAGSRDLSIRASLTAALLTYNHSDSYVATVLAWIDGYRAGHITPLPPQDPPPSPTDSPTSPPPSSTPPTSTPPTTPPPTETDPGPTSPQPTAPVPTSTPTVTQSPSVTDTPVPSDTPSGTEQPTTPNTDDPHPTETHTTAAIG